jgi:hypothetical protein
MRRKIRRGSITSQSLNLKERVVRPLDAYTVFLELIHFISYTFRGIMDLQQKCSELAKKIGESIRIYSKTERKTSLSGFQGFGKGF